MDKNSILEFNNKESVSDVLNELLRNGAQKLIHNAVEAELREFMSQQMGSLGLQGLLVQQSISLE